VLDARATLRTLHLGDTELESEIAPKGLRLLRRVNKLTPEMAAKIANHFGGLARLQRVSVSDLMGVDGIDEEIASTVKETLERVTENTILDQYS
jgi:diadenylate cyclase